MKKLILIGILIITLFLVACTSIEDENIAKEDLKDASNEELVDLATSEDVALAGQAIVAGKSRKERLAYKRAATNLLKEELISANLNGNIQQALEESKKIKFSTNESTKKLVATLTGMELILNDEKVPVMIKFIDSVVDCNNYCSCGGRCFSWNQQGECNGCVCEEKC